MESALVKRPPRYSIFVLSMTALAYEILLMRLFSIIQWHHFAYMIISLALLGYGASGTFLALFRQYLLPRYERVYLLNIILFGLSSLFFYLLSQQIQFNAEEILWDYHQGLKLVAIYVLLALPFFFVANAIGLSFVRFRGDMSRIYAADLLGAGMGSILIIVLLFAVLPGTALKFITVFAMLAFVIAGVELYRKKPKPLRISVAISLIVILMLLLMPSSWIELKISPYKGLSQILRINGANIVTQSSSPLGLVSVVESPIIPFRYAPGLSLNATTEPPKQIGVFVDGDGMTPITKYTGDRKTLSYLGQLTSALPYHLASINKVLILGSGSGSSVLQATYYHTKQINAVELNRQIIDLVRNRYNQYSGYIYDINNRSVRVYAKEARGFIAASNDRYELIQLALAGSFGSSGTGLYALSESYLVTTEAMQQYIKRLKPEGYLAISRWVKLPPRDTLKLLATAIDALKNNGIQNPEQHIALIRGLQTSTLLVKKSIFREDEISKLKEFSNKRSFDVAYYPRMPSSEANRYNKLAKPYYYIAAKALLGQDRDAFIKRYKFNLIPATDDRPYFFQFFKWQTLPEIISLVGQGGMPLVEWGYMVLIVTLIQALSISVLLILLPLVFYRRSLNRQKNRYKLRYFIYFLSLGLAFLFIEIAFIQKFILFLHHPVMAVAVVLAAFLIFAGMGSLWTKKISITGRYSQVVKRSVLVIVVIGLSYSFFLGYIFSSLIALPIAFRIIISVILISPLAFCMGIPFPVALSRLSELNPGLIPWVWGVNGCASVLSAVLASLLAIHFGFTFVIQVALVFYILASLLITDRDNPGIKS